MTHPAFPSVKTIIWDWNGTLLNDVDVCVETLNVSLAKRNLPVLTSEVYRSIFTFPVIEYYKLAGFSFHEEPFEKVAVEFMENYRINIRNATLHPRAMAILDLFMKKGLEQHVLSAMEQGLLENLLDHFQIGHYFKHIQGVGDDYATGKNNVARHLAGKLSFPKDQICLVGDTLHDLEVAQKIGISCILSAGGHQSFQRLSAEHPYVIQSLDYLPGLLGLF